MKSAARQIIQACERIVLTLWVGGIWVSGYVAAPLLFQQLDDRQLAGRLAGNLFEKVGWIGLLCGLLLVVLYAWPMRSRWRAAAVTLMLTLTLVNLLVLAPQIEALRDAGLLASDAAARRHFGLLHATASGLFLLVSVVGLLLVTAGSPTGRPDRSS